MPKLSEYSGQYFNTKYLSRLATLALVMLFIVLSWSEGISATANAQVDAGLKRSLVVTRMMRLVQRYLCISRRPNHLSDQYLTSSAIHFPSVTTTKA